MTVSSGSSIAGLPCANADRRPLAVMMAADAVARPLSGIGMADMIFEMPVTPGKIPRYMAIFQCEDVSAIGSIRSARQDFLPLVTGLKAIYVHWGGEREALEILNRGGLDNIDALKYEGTVFYRKRGVPMPHNGFTDSDALLNKAEDLSYALSDTFAGYPHSDSTQRPHNLANIAHVISVEYAEPYQVRWVYDEGSRMYARFRGTTAEVDALTGEQVRARVIIVMETQSRILNQDYISVDVTGSGVVRVYQDGSMMSGRWEKQDSTDAKLFFYDEKRREIPFAPGRIWVHIDATPR